MEPNPVIFARLHALNWFSLCSVKSRADLPFPTERLNSIGDAIASSQSNLWTDVKTEAQGDLTAHLAKYHYDAYCDWNRLGNEIEERVQRDVRPKVNEALGKIRAEVLLDAVLLDVVRIALWSTYSNQFRRAPGFFNKLLMVYERGHLPCGWSGDIDSWPEGQLIIY